MAGEFSARSDQEITESAEIRSLLLANVEKMGPKWDVHLPTFLTAPSLARVLWLDLVYRQAADIPGSLVEFGSQWGASFNTFLLLKQIHEPWNAGRKLLSFSTFAEGFASVDSEDGTEVANGDYAVAENWQHDLNTILKSHAERSPLGAESNFEIIPGDARESFAAYLADHPELVISHVHFDLDLYAPTRDLLTTCLERMPKGAILIFDEINCPSFPGETRALDEVLGIPSLALRKSPYQPYSAYAIIGD